MSKKISIFYILVLLFISCNKEEQENETANFVVSEVKLIDLKTTKTTKSSGLNDLKDTAHYSLKFCMKDMAVNRPITNQSFSIIIDGVETKSQSDSEGCLNWYGGVKYSMLSCESITETQAKITGHDNYNGSTSIPLFLNPTAKTTKSFTDGRYQELAVSNSACEESQLKIKKIQFTRIKESHSSLKFKTAVIPALARQLLDGEIEEIALKSNGNFDLQVNLLALINGDYQLIETVKTDVSIRNQKINKELEFSLPRYDMNSDDLKFAMEINIKSKDEQSLPGFRGIVYSNDYNFSTITEIQELEEAIDFSLMSITEKNNTESTSLIESSYLYIESVENDNSDEYSQNKTKKISLKSCFHQKYSTAEKVIFHDTEVKLNAHSNTMSLTQLSPKTNEMGCIRYNIFVNYDLFGQRRDYKNSITFSIRDNNGKVEQINHNIMINPWKNNKTLTDLKDIEVTQADIEENDSRLLIDKASYKLLGNEDTGYYVNKFAQLYIKKKYSLELKPLVDLSQSYDQVSKPMSLNFGNLKAKVYLFSPNKKEVDFKNIDLNDFTLLSTAQTTAEIGKTGIYYIEPTFPLEVSDAIYLATKSLLVVELLPQEGLEGLKGAKFAVEFFGTNSNETLKNAFTIESELTEEQKLLSQAMIDDDHAFALGLTKKITQQNSLDLYKEHLKQGIKNIEFTSFNSFLNRDEVKKAKINYLDLRTYSLIDGVTPKARGLQEKLCKVYYPNRLDYFSKKDCIENFNNHIKVTGAEHLVEVISYDDYSQEYNVAKAQVIKGSEINNGKVSIGKAYMAAKGTRSSQSWGERSGFSESVSASMYYDGPPSVFFITAGVSKSHETFDMSVNAKMQMEFKRMYSDLKELDLTYNKVSMSFDGATKRCILIQDVKENKRNLHICEDRLLKKNIKEDWFFIGELDAQKHGVLTDGVEIGEQSHLRVIRGEKNFQKVWSQFEGENVMSVMEEMKDYKLGETFLDYKRNQNININYEIGKDNSFPGLLR